MRIALAQINTTVGDLKGNCKKILQYVKKAQAVDADIVLFPELAVCGYPPEDLLYKDQFVKDNQKALKSLAKKIKIPAVVGFVDGSLAKGLTNAAAIISNGKIKGVYHKKDLPNYGVFDEKRYFISGKQNCVISLGKNLLGVSICEDIWSPQGNHCGQISSGAKVLLNISSSPYDIGKYEARKKLLSQISKKKKTPICYVNLVGGQDELVFDGGSLVFDSKGKLIASGKQFEEDFVVVDLDIEEAKRGATKNKLTVVRVVKNSVTPSESIKPPKPSVLKPIECIYKALVLGTRDYVKKNGFKKVVIGLSGGIDSALVAALAVEALGKENVVGITMPSQFSSKGTKSDAKKLAENFGIKFLTVPIEPIFKSYEISLSKHFKGTKVNVAEENIQARIRGNILMAFSNKFGWLVLTTGNKSEVAVGYCTLYGDMSGGFAVIKDVPKVKVYELTNFINKIKGSLIPESIIKRPPTAELRKNQKDQDSLPPYEVLDPILEGYVEEHQSLRQLRRQKLSLREIKDVIKKVDNNEYKRRQSPPGIKITSRAFGKDWRIPITHKYKEK